LWADQGKNLDRSLKMVQTAVDAEPENKAYRDSLGWAFFKLGRFHEAIEQLEQAVGDADSDGVIFDHLGDAYAADKQPAKAEEAWKRAVELLKKQGDEAKAAKVTDKIKQLSKSE
jgi:tetratricopeptide (TPR) repeat protein